MLQFESGRNALFQTLENKETVKKTLVLMPQKLQQQETRFAGGNFSLGKSYPRQIWFLVVVTFVALKPTFF
jgi:hypothetical protein